MKARKQDAQKVLKDVREMFQSYSPFGEYGPSINETWEPGTVLVAWEEGPFEWSYDAASKINEKYNWGGKGPFVEPMNSWSLAVYKPGS